MSQLAPASVSVFQIVKPRSAAVRLRGHEQAEPQPPPFLPLASFACQPLRPVALAHHSGGPPHRNGQPDALRPYDRGNQLLLRRRNLCRAGARPRAQPRLGTRSGYWPMVARGDSIVNVSADETDGPSTAAHAQSQGHRDHGHASLACRSRERWLLGHPRAPAHRLHRIVLRQDRQPGPSRHRQLCKTIRPA